MVMPICAKGPPNDLFWDDCSPSWSEYAAKEECRQMFEDVGYDGAFFRPNSIINNYGGNFAGYSNVIFRYYFVYFVSFAAIWRTPYNARDVKKLSKFRLINLRTISNSF